MCKVFDGIKEKEQRIKKTKQCKKLVYKKYQKKAKWLSKCTLAQLDKAIDIILENLTYKQFKTEVLKE